MRGKKSFSILLCFSLILAQTLVPISFAEEFEAPPASEVVVNQVDENSDLTSTENTQASNAENLEEPNEETSELPVEEGLEKKEITTEKLEGFKKFLENDPLGLPVPEMELTNITNANEPVWENIDLEYQNQGKGNISWFSENIGKETLQISDEKDLIGLSDIVNGKVLKLTKVYETKGGVTTIKSESEEPFASDLKEKSIELLQDIDMKGELWTPIGDEEHNFSGKFDGKSHTIKGLKSVEELENAAFIGYGKSCEIKNLALSDYDFSAKSEVSDLICKGEDVKAKNILLKGKLSGEGEKSAICRELKGKSEVSSVLYLGNPDEEFKKGGCEKYSKIFVLANEDKKADDISKITAKYLKEHKKGISYKLDTKENNNGEIESKSKIWTAGEEHPVLTDDKSRCFYKAIIVENTEAKIEIGSKYKMPSEAINIEATSNVEEKVVKSVSIEEIGGKTNKLYTKPYSFVMPEKNIKISAELIKKSELGDFKDEYSTTFFLKGGKILGQAEEQEQYVVKRKSGEAIIPPEVERESFNLVGWYTDENCKHKFDFDNLKDYKELYKDIKLYAKWAKDGIVTVHFDFNDAGKGNNDPIDAQIVGKGDKLSPVKKPEWVIKKIDETPIEYHKFLGWYTEKEDGKGKKWDFKEDAISLTNKASEMTLYAHWDKDITDHFSTGTKEKPCEIPSLKILEKLRDNVNEGHPYADCYFILTKDIALVNSVGEDLKWKPIGDKDNPFSGNFDGNNKNISKLKPSDEDIKYWGFFGFVKDAKISNLNISTSDSITGGEKNHIGVIAGHARGNVLISNCVASGQIFQGNSAGGILGTIGGKTGNIKIENCKNFTNIEYIDEMIGGICAGFYQRGVTSTNVLLELVNCQNEGKLALQKDRGKIAGIIANMEESRATKIFKCTNKGKISARESDACGGIAGALGVICEISECENEGSVISSGTSVGGIVGQMYQLACVTDCTNKRTATIGTKGDKDNMPTKNVGGIVGKFSGGSFGNSQSNVLKFSNCLNESDIFINGQTAGGLVGNFGGAVQNEFEMTGLVNTGNITMVSESPKNNAGIGGIFGEAKCIYQRLHDVCNKGNIQATGGVIGGICGIIGEYTHIENAYNVGEIKLETTEKEYMVGGIVGKNDNRASYIINSYNFSDLEFKSYPNENNKKINMIADGGEDKIRNCYYLSKDNADVDTVEKGLNKRSLNQFTNGMVAYELDYNNKNTRTFDWIQGKEYPVFTKEGAATYKYNVNKTDNGKLNPLSGYKNSGERMEFKIEPDAGNMLKSAKVIGKDNKEYRANIDAEHSKLWFVMPQVDVDVEGKFISVGSFGNIGIDTCKVKYHLDKETVTKIVKLGSTVEQIDAGKKEGFVFDGWYTESSLKNKYNFNLAVTADLDLYPKFIKEDEIEINVEFNLNGGTLENLDKQTLKLGDLVKDPGAPKKLGPNGEIYFFEGWFTEVNAGKKWNFEKDTVRESMILFAHWQSGDKYASGTKSNPYVFTEEEDLKEFADRVSQGFGYAGKYFSLGKDIYLDGEWQGIGYVKIKAKRDVTEITESGTVPFQGNFDGREFTINLPSEIMHGLFGAIGTDGTVENINVKAKLGESNKRAIFGGIADINFGKIDKCNVELRSIGNGNVDTVIGGIAGINPGNIYNCTALVEFYQNGSAFYRGAQGLGGIVGYLMYGTVNSCRVKKGTIISVPSSCNGMHIGGISGTAPSDSTTILSNRATLIRSCIVEQGVILKNFADGMSFQITTGGLTGYGGDIYDCFCGADIEVKKGQVGLLAGYCQNVGAGSVLHDCVWFGNKAKASGDKKIKFTSSLENAELTNCYVGIVGDKIDDEDVSSIDKNKFEGQYKNEKQFKSGEVAYLLDGGDKAHRNAWTQDKDANLPYPGKPSIYKVSLKVSDPENAGNAVKMMGKTYKDGTSIELFAPLGNLNLSVEKNPGYTRILPDGSKKIVKFNLSAFANGSDISNNIEKFAHNGNVELKFDFKKTEKIEEKEKPEDEGKPGGGKGGRGKGGDGDGKGEADSKGIGDGTSGDTKSEGDGTNATGVDKGSKEVQNIPKYQGELGKNAGETTSLEVAEANPFENPVIEQAEVPQDTATQIPDIGSAESASEEGEDKQDQKEDEEKFTIFEIVKKTVKENPLIAVAGASLIIIFTAGGMLSKAGVFSGLFAGKTGAGAGLASLKSRISNRFKKRK